MNPEFSDLCRKLGEFISNAESGAQSAGLEGSLQSREEDAFNSLALELFEQQFAHNAAYRRFCQARGIVPRSVADWWQIPAVPASGFKDADLSCLAPFQRTAVFHSSGTTEQRPSRHFHNDESLAIYEASLWAWFAANVLCDYGAVARPGNDFKSQISNLKLLVLTPPKALVMHSSLVHMFDTVRLRLGAAGSAFVGGISDESTWKLDLDAALQALRNSVSSGMPSLLLGTAFSFVHLLDFLMAQGWRFDLPAGSRVIETGGYKGRSRVVSKADLNALIEDRLGIPPSHIICEYGMSELSSQAYDTPLKVEGEGRGRAEKSRITHHASRNFYFPPWARVQIVSPETGCEVAEGETGLIRVFDLANVFSVMAIQTEDLGVRRGSGFELLGRAIAADPKGCSLMAV
jgi:hypothetical protein